AQVSELKKMDEDNLVDDVEMLDAFDEDDEGDD
ncbi:DNA-binding protein, partial [Raoultella ornithinolytica]